MQYPHLMRFLTNYNGRQRDALLPLLWDVQTAFGHINHEMVHAISHTLRVPEVDIYGVISFYTLFHDQPTGKNIIRVCTDPSCGLANADEVLDGLCSRLGIHHGETSDDGHYTVEHTACLGLCDLAPAALISKRGEGEIAIAPITSLDELLNGNDDSYIFHVDGNPSILLDRVVDNSPESIDDYGHLFNT